MAETTGFPLTLSDWLPWLLLLLLGAAGGFINYYSRWRRQQRIFSLFALIGELTTSGFVAVLIALTCQALGINRIWSTVLAGIGAHLGPRALFVIEWIGLRRIGLPQPDVEMLVEPPTGFPARRWIPPTEPKPGSEPGSEPGSGSGTEIKLGRK